MAVAETEAVAREAGAGAGTGGRRAGAGRAMQRAGSTARGAAGAACWAVVKAAARARVIVVKAATVHKQVAFRQDHS